MVQKSEWNHVNREENYKVFITYNIEMFAFWPEGVLKLALIIPNRISELEAKYTHKLLKNPKNGIVPKEKEKLKQEMSLLWSSF